MNNSFTGPSQTTAEIYNKSEIISSCFFYTIISITAIFGNGLVVGSFCLVPKLRTATNIFVVSLACADIMVGCVSVPIWMYILITGVTDRVLIQIYSSLDIISGVSSILHLMVISCERLLAVITPFRHRSIPRNLYYIILAIIWIIACSLGGFMELVQREYLDSGTWVLIVFMLFFLFPLVIIITDYIFIWKVAMHRARNPIGEGQRTLKKDMRVTVTIAIVIGLFVITWLPFFLMQIVSIYCFTCDFYPIVKTVLLTKFMHYSNSSVNPIVYAVRMPEFRKSFLRLLGYHHCCGSPRNLVHPAESSSSTASPGKPSTSSTVHHPHKIPQFNIMKDVYGQT